MAYQLSLWRNDTFRDAAVLCAIKHQNSSINAHCGNDVRILWLVSSLVNLSWMINLLLDVHFDGSLFSRAGVAVATNLSALFIVIMWVGCNVLWEFNICDL